MYDISSQDSFAKAREWVKELQRQGNPHMIMSLAGNKADLADTRQVRTPSCALKSGWEGGGDGGGGG